jgi:hypothetical protein
MPLTHPIKTAELNTRVTHRRTTGETSTNLGYPVRSVNEVTEIYWAKVTPVEVKEMLPGETEQDLGKRIDMHTHEVVLRNEGQQINTGDTLIIPTPYMATPTTELTIRQVSGDVWHLRCLCTIRK